jgi:hypothetical protein
LDWQSSTFQLEQPYKLYFPGCEQLSPECDALDPAHVVLRINCANTRWMLRHTSTRCSHGVRDCLFAYITCATPRPIKEPGIHTVDAAGFPNGACIQR